MAEELHHIPLSSPHFGPELEQFDWRASVEDYLDGFEQDLTGFSGVSHVVATQSGTSAIHLALILSGVQPGDEVICQSLTFAGMAFPIRYLGAVPVFVDSEKDTWNIDPVLLEEAIEDRIRKSGKKPKAILPVHIFGMPAKMDEIRKVAGEFQIPVIEDAAEALGSYYKEKPCGSLGDLSVYSFNSNKIITTSGGGALLSDNKEIVEKAKYLAGQAKEPFLYYEHRSVGYNYRMSHINAGIGRKQLRILEERINKRRVICTIYQEQLADTGIQFQPEAAVSRSNRWLTAIQIDHEKADIHEWVRKFAKQNTEVRPVWKPLHLQPVFKDFPAYLNGNSSMIYQKGLCLPSGSNLKDEDLDRVISTLKREF